MSLPAAVCVVGAGGHCKVVIATLRAAGHRVEGVFDDDTRKHGTRVLGVPVVGPVRALPRRPGALAVIALGDNRSRERMARQLRGVQWAPAVAHPGSVVHP